MKLLLATGVLALAPLSQALAWGDVGHRFVCEIAFREAAPATQDAIKALIATDGHFTTFSDACTWPDHPRQRADEHFINLPRNAESDIQRPVNRQESRLAGVSRNGQLVVINPES